MQFLFPTKEINNLSSAESASESVEIFRSGDWMELTGSGNHTCCLLDVEDDETYIVYPLQWTRCKILLSHFMIHKKFLQT